MIGDAYGKVSDAQAITSATAANPLESTSSVDRLAAADITVGSQPKLTFTVTTTLTPKLNGVTVTMTNANDLVVYNSHGLLRGTPVVLHAAAGATIAPPSVAGTIYYVIPYDANSFQLAESLANAMAGTKVTLTDDSSGTITLTTLATLTLEMVEADNDALTQDPVVIGSSGPLTMRIPRTCTFTGDTEIVSLVAHGFETETPIVFAGGTLPTGLTLGTTYYAIRIDADTFYVASTVELARAGTYLTFVGDGTAPTTVQRRDLLFTDNTGPNIVVEANPRASGTIGKRYLGARYVVDVPVGAGAFTAIFGGEPGTQTKKYPIGYEILL